MLFRDYIGAYFQNRKKQNTLCDRMKAIRAIIFTIGLSTVDFMIAEIVFNIQVIKTRFTTQ